MGLKKETSIGRKSTEKMLINNIMKFTNINCELKIIDIHDDVLKQLSEEQKLYLNALKKYKYSLQYIIK